MDDKYLEFYCSECGCDRRGLLSCSLASVDELSRIGLVEVDAICEECGNTIVTYSTVITLQ